MLGFMRKHMKFFFVFFWLVIISFVLWGVGGIKDPGSDAVITIGKYNATLDEYRNTYNRLYDFYKEIYKDKFNDELLKKLDLKKKSVDEIVQKRLLLQEAKRIGLEVTDEEIKEFIFNFPAFQKDGRFDNEIYQRVLELNRITPEGFIQMQKEDLTVGKMRRMISDSVVVTDKELTETLTERLRSEGKSLKAEEFNKLKDAMREFVLKEKQDRAITSHIEALKAQTKIVINDKILGS